jgi:putative hydrolase of the HAD superfamily
MLRAILFDLDDTLYEERQFFRSGFSWVARMLEERGRGAHEQTLALLEQWHHGESREGVFQKLAARLDFPEAWIPELVLAFRSHEPVISLAPDAADVLPRLRDRYRLGCITDGWAAVQRRKLAALGVTPLLDAVVVADDFGRDRWKPHPFPFQRCCELLAVDPADALFVGDNPFRDLPGALRAGLRTARIRRDGAYFAAAEAETARLVADLDVRDLFELQCRLREWDVPATPGMAPAGRRVGHLA